MTKADIAVNVCLAICVIMTMICCWGLLLIHDFYERLHFLSTITTVSTFALLLAIVVKEGWGQATIKGILVYLVLLLINAVLTHATARAARVREFGHWTVDPSENVEGAGGKRRGSE